MKKVFIILIILFSFISCVRDNYETFPIISIIREEGFAGDFFLGTGSIGDITYYVSFVKVSTDTLKLIKIDIDRCLIHEIDVGEPYVLINIRSDHDISVRQRIKNGRYTGATMIFYVPKGTILKEFKL